MESFPARAPAPFSRARPRSLAVDLRGRRDRPFGDCDEKTSRLMRHFSRHGDLATANFPHCNTYINLKVLIQLKFGAPAITYSTSGKNHFHEMNGDAGMAGWK